MENTNPNENPAQQQEQVENILNQSQQVIEEANKEITDPKTPPTNDDPGTAAFKGIPMSELIGAPLIEAAKAQQRLAGITWDFFQQIAYEDPDKKTPRLLSFELERPVVQDGVVGNPEKIKVNAPFIGLVQTPATLIDRIDIDFQMEVTDTNLSSATSTAEATTSASAKWFGVTASVSGKVSTSRENTRTTNQTAKYQVHVSASQQPQTEGMSKLMDIMASCIEPISSGSK